jgi:hypothetical protein
MRIRAGMLAIILSCAPLPAWSASVFWDAAQKLDGMWESDVFLMKIDSARAQASVDPKKPFQWQRFIVKDVAEDTIVFTIGSEMFEATLESDELILTSSSFRGERILQRPQPLLGLRR